MAFGVLAWMLAAGDPDLLQSEPYGNFYDAQAEALADGHWDVPASELFYEGFRIGDKTYTYFGIWPSLLRMPVLALDDSLYGRLTQLSMLLAFAVALAGLVALNWRIRALLRPDAPLSPAEGMVALAVPVVFGCGTTAIFLASRAWVYHEAILWGVAWSLVSYERLLAFTRAPSTARLAAASCAAALALSSRAAVGIGPVLALALILLGQTLRRVREVAARRHAGARPLRLLHRLDWLGPRRRAEPDGPNWLLGALLATAVPLLLYAYVNWSRFGTFLTVPWRKQALFSIDPATRAVLDANGGTYLGLKYVPTTLLQYARPDAIAPDALFPFVTFPRFRTPVIGHVEIDALDFSSSIPASMPALTLLAIVGVAAACSTRFARTPDAALLRGPLLGAAGAIVPALAIAFVANRYLGDWLPLLVIAALAGLHSLLARRQGAGSARSRRRVTVVLAASGVLALLSVWIASSLALVYQRLYNPHPESLRAGMLELQYEVDDLLGGGARQARQVTELPVGPARAGTVAVVGDCAALYWSDGREWHFVEGNRDGGLLRLRGPLPPPGDDAWRPLASWGRSGAQDVIGLRRVGARVQVSLGQPRSARPLVFNPFAVHLEVPDEPDHVFEIRVDRPRREVIVHFDGRGALTLVNVGRLQPGSFTVGSSDTPGISSRYGAPLRELAPEIRACTGIRFDSG